MQSLSLDSDSYGVPSNKNELAVRFRDRVPGLVLVLGAGVGWRCCELAVRVVETGCWKVLSSSTRRGSCVCCGAGATAGCCPDIFFAYLGRMLV